jgi:2-keto-4-pentenoate hydratase
MTMSKAAIDKAVKILWQARLHCQRLQNLPDDCRPATLDEGYAIQDAMAASCGQKVAGWKIAATSTAGQRHIGVSEPIGGRLFADFVLKGGAVLPVAPLLMRVVEAEFAFRMGRNLDPRPAAYTKDEVLDAVADLHVAIEVPDGRFEKFAEAGPGQIAADDAYASWFILGPKIAGWEKADLVNHPVRMMKNGRVGAAGSGAAVLGDPRIALTWLANDRAKRGVGLKAGDIVTTGTCIKPLEIGPNDKVTADFGSLGQVSLNFA